MAGVAWLAELLRAEWPLIGMVHLRALPGSPDDEGDLEPPPDYEGSDETESSGGEEEPPPVASVHCCKCKMP